MTKNIMRSFWGRKLYAITAEELSRGRNNIEVVSAMIDGGVGIVQYREKRKSMKEMYDECRELRELTRSAGITFIINDHIDLALAVNADGVHIGQDDLPPQITRGIIGEHMILGLSVHTVEQAERARRSGVCDYVGVGPVFATTTKPDAAAAVGLDGLAAIAGMMNVPVVAIGGIKEADVQAVVGAGGSVVAMISEIVAADDIAAKITSLKDRLRY